MEGGKLENPEENPRGKGENQQTQHEVPEPRIEPTTHWTTAVRARLSILPQRHPFHTFSLILKFSKLHNSVSIHHIILKLDKTINFDILFSVIGFIF
jgi:hypothetical protein